MAEANRSIEEIVESARSASSSHRPVGPFGPIPKNSGMEQDGTFARTPIVAGEMPRRRSNTSTASAAYHTVQGSGTDGSESAGYRTTSEHAAETGALAATDSLLPSQLAKNYKATSYWSRSGESSSARGSVSAEQGRRGSGVFVTSGSSSRSEPAASRTRAAARRQQETAEAMTYEERHSVRGGGRRSSDHERYRNVSSSAESSAGARPARFPFQRAENGGMRVSEGMVAYQDRNLAILVADPVHTRLRVQAKEKHAKSTGSVTDRMSADIHASYENLSTIQQRAARDASAERRSSGGSQRAGAERRDQFYETSEYGSQRRQETRWEAESSGHERSSRAGGGSGRAMSERSAGGASRPGSRASVSRRDSGFSFEFRDQLGVSGSASSVAEQSSSRRRSLSPRPAASARFSQADDAPGTLQRVMQPAEDTVAVDDGQETDGFTTRFVRQETAGSRKAASATTLYMAPTAAGAAGRGGPAATSGAGGFSRADGAVDEAGYPRRASGDWRRRSSAAALVIEDEVCDLEEREEVVSVGQKERISYHRTDAESSLEKSARRTQQQQQYSHDNERPIPGGYQRYSGASGGAREKRELGCLSEEAVRSSRYDQCCACRHFRARFERRC
ncbi:uncharacterized protein LOC122376743 [Amphibalanus amphitrite]|uniref:uncharacterized protein LOC122376743 n=1 Tax=Amphibalanus amphitrite TaxID=1232801 RepID=UPI001C900DD4|nr:uncharacterized protein LOC122376743 [Amphibalanus amphitrite]